MPEMRKRSRRETRELRRLYTDRYKRIKDERKIFVNTLIGLSGGAIVLSITFLEKIAPKKYLIGLVIVAWCLLGLSLLGGVFRLVWMIWRSQQFQRKLDRLLRTENVAFSEHSHIFDPYYRGSGDMSGCPEVLVGCFFVFGVLALAAFAIVNLVRG